MAGRSAQATGMVSDRTREVEVAGWTREIKQSSWARAKGHRDFPLRGHSLQAPSPPLDNQCLFILSIAPQLRQLLSQLLPILYCEENVFPSPLISTEGR